MTHINSISSGQGAPSTYLIVMAGLGHFSCEHVIVADTGDEKQLLANDGNRYDAMEYFHEVTRPLAEEFGMTAHFVRARRGDGTPLPDIHTDQYIDENGRTRIDLPVFGSNGGRLSQSCTSKWKTAAVRQTLRDLGATTATTALGMTLDETHRLKKSTVKWQQLSYPLAFARLHRATIQKKLEKMSIPYLLHTQCNKCPHKDIFRWKLTDSSELRAAAQFESQFSGQFFLTADRIPLLDAINQMDSRRPTRLLDSLPCATSCGL